jgi:hypothetical protein
VTPMTPNFFQARARRSFLKTASLLSHHRAHLALRAGWAFCFSGDQPDRNQWAAAIAWSRGPGFPGVGAPSHNEGPGPSPPSSYSFHEYMITVSAPLG